MSLFCLDRLMKRAPLLILGAGGFAREALCWLPEDIEVLGFFSQTPTDEKLLGLPVFSDLSAFYKCEFLPAVGDPKLKEKLWDMAMEFGLEPCPPIIHPTATIGRGVYIEEGSIICPQAVITTEVSVGVGFLLNLGATVGHDCAIGDFVTVSPGANISGNVTIGDSAYIGTNASIRERLIIGEDAIVGMGAVVVKTVPSNVTVIGSPARQIPPKPLT